MNYNMKKLLCYNIIILSLMSFEHYFNKSIVEKKPLCIKDEYAMKLKTELYEYLNNKIIDQLEYNYMLEFIKSKGNITMAKKYFDIIKKIPSSDYTSILFDNLIILFDDCNMIKSNKLIINMEKYGGDIFKFTVDQKNAVQKLCEFLYGNDNVYSIYGRGGTGKTTTIIKLIQYMIYKNYINSVAVSAPTHKTINLLKSKFKDGLNQLVKSKFKVEPPNNESFDDTLNRFADRNIKINFMTLHKLLNFKNDFDNEGNRVFVKSTGTKLNNYNLVIIDECSMISFDMMLHILTEMNNNKILFIGDPAQLNPVNEKMSIIFASSESDFKLKTFSDCINKGKIIPTVSVESQFEKFKNSIINMKSIVLNEVMRSNDTSVVGICNEMRASVLGEIKYPKFYKYRGDKVFLYKYDKKSNKVNTEWFEKAFSYFADNKSSSDSIILTWTNKQSDEYNNITRMKLYKKDKLNKYEIGDILILTDFYNINDNKTQSFYSSDQIRIIDINMVNKVIPAFVENISDIKGIKIMNDVKEKYIKTMKLINKTIKRDYLTYKLHIIRVSDMTGDNNNNITQQIYVISDRDNNILTRDKEFATEKIKELSVYYRNMHKESINIIDNRIIKPLWKELNNNLVDCMAKVSVSFSISSHKSQSSTFYNTFVDMDDIFKNSNIEEAKRCLYTAMSRTSNELHLLI